MESLTRRSQTVLSEPTNRISDVEALDFLENLRIERFYIKYATFQIIEWRSD